MFWFIAIGLSLLASAFLAWPLLRSHSVAATVPSQGQINKRVIREQLQELEADFASNKIDARQLQKLQDELYATALGDNLQDSSGGLSQASLARPQLTLAALAGGLGVAAVLCYLYLGYLADLRIAEKLQQPQTSDRAADSLKELIPAIEQQLQRRPANTGYRYLLAQTQMQAQRYTEAAQSFKQLLDQFADDAQLWAYYAQALYLADGRSLSATAQQALQHALQIDPRQSTALGLQGMAAFERQDYSTAVAAWKGLLAGLPPASAQASTINAALQRAMVLVGQSGDRAVAANATPASIIVKVKAAIDAPPSADTTVFIYARAVAGPKMPLAIQRLQLRDLPATIELDDSMAMSPAMNLSSVDRVEIVARVSLSGQPTAQSGDWEARSQPIRTGEQADPVELLIDRQIE